MVGATLGDERKKSMSYPSKMCVMPSLVAIDPTGGIVSKRSMKLMPICSLRTGAGGSDRGDDKGGVA